MKKLTLLLAAAVLAALVLTPGIAYANYAIHGGYTADTDACAGCHRAHTSVSSVTWNDKADGTGTDHSALLVSNAAHIYEFCYACHDNSAQGADTNVEGGIYKGTIAGNTQNGDLNGGFAGDQNAHGDPITSDHVVNDGGWGAWGGGGFGQGLTNAYGDTLGWQLGKGSTIIMSCVSCHDPHGSSNYRLLADKVNGNAVGGYDENDVPKPFVISSEPGYPNGANGPAGGRIIGWQKHEAGHNQIAGNGAGNWPGYRPQYTRPLYAVAPPNDPNAAAPATQSAVARGMSGWCAGCHNAYVLTGAPHGANSFYDHGDGWTRQSRHRHPMNINLRAGRNQGSQTKTLAATITPANVDLPLAHDPNNLFGGGAETNVWVSGTGSTAVFSNESTNAVDDWLDCLTCHVAHGSAKEMTGFANVNDSVTDPAFGGTLDALKPNSGQGGVMPTNDSALLRKNNRGVCEACHNK